MTTLTAVRARSTPLVRSIPAWAWVGGLVVCSAAIRFQLARRVAAPWIMLDELIYSELAEEHRLGRGGVVVLDVWNPPAHRSGERTIRGGVRERKTVSGGRLRTEPEYGDGTLDVPDFRLYEPAELARLGELLGLEQTLLCSRADEARAPSADDLRYQLVMRRTRP